jgi:23S rRNA pseudouridine2605 synthase
VLGDKVASADKVYVSGKRVVEPKTRYRYIMLNKPRGFITTMSDERGRKCVAELVADVGERVYPIGRLDKDSEGMLVFTNDGEFANKLMHPRNSVYKYYRVTVRPSIDEEQLVKLETGIELDGKKTAPAIVHVVSKQEGRVVLEMILHEGKNREIRRMCEAVGLEVARLRRTQIGNVKMGMLKQGDWRDLTEKDIKNLTANPIVNGRTI